MRLSDRVTGPAIALLGALAAWGGSRLPPVPGQDVGPNVFPIVIGGGMVLCGVLIALGIGRSFEEPGEDFGAGMPLLRRLLFGLRALIPPALLLFYVLAVERLGFLPTAFAMVGVAALAMGARPRLALPLALLAPLAIHLVFSKLLRVPLPEGLLPVPW